MIFLLIVAPQTFINISVNIIFYKHVYRKVPCFLENTPHTIRISSISTKEFIAPISVLWYWILKEPRTVHVYKIEVEQNTKQRHRITLLNAIPHQKLSRWYGFQAQYHSFTASIHMLMLMCINYSLSILLQKIHHFFSRVLQVFPNS